jgi:hypothetical protein
MTTITVSSVAGKRTWTRVGERPHVCKDGGTTRLAVWTAGCAICGEPFEVLTPRQVISAAGSRAFTKVTCKIQRLTPAEASRLSGGGGPTARERFEEIAKLACEAA